MAQERDNAAGSGSGNGRLFSTGGRGRGRIFMIVRSARPFFKNKKNRGQKILEEKVKRGRGRPPGSTKKVLASEPAALPVATFELRKRRLFAKAINKYAPKTIRELKQLLEDVEDRAALEIMAIRALLRAAEDGNSQAINLVLNPNPTPHGRPPKVAPPPAPAEPELPDPGEFDGAEPPA